MRFGIFLRTLLELQFDSVGKEITTSFIEEAFEHVFGMDIDTNACQATRLSLSLLHLVLVDSLPKKLNIVTTEAIECFQSQVGLRNSLDAVIANPPFVALATQQDAIRERVAEYMSDYASGRIDTYLAFLRMGLEMLKPGGYGCFVLPHSFLLAKSASKMREELSEKAWVHVLADLSAIRVFGKTGSYVILIVFQKKSPTIQDIPSATIIKCQDQVGRALQDALDRRYIEKKSYSVYQVAQDTFMQNEWVVMPPTEEAIKRKFSQLPTISDFLFVRQGFISGADDVLILTKERLRELIPERESNIFIPYLPDWEMHAYTVAAQPSHYFFYPYINGRLIEESEF